MTLRALLGLGLLNVFLLAVGMTVLRSIRGWSSIGELARLSGLAYMLGVALVGVVLTLELVLGVPFSLATVVLTGIGVAAAAVALRRPFARWRPEPTPSQSNEPGLALVAAAFAVLLVVYLEALFRASRLSGLSAWDAWSFWVPKAKAIYYFGGLDEQFFRELPNPSYPPLVPTLEAAAFHAMGSPDVVTLHVQFWFFACGFVAAVAGLLAPRVSPVFVWPTLLLVLATPRVVGRNLDPQADFLLDYLFALSALLVLLWLLDEEPWLLAAATPLLAAGLLTKRDGQLLVACIVLAAMAASVRRWRSAWPRLWLVAAIAFAASVPWRIWFSSRDLSGELPSSGLLGLFDNLDRGWPAFKSAVTTAFDYDLWLLMLPIVAAVVVLAFVAGARLVPTYALVLYATVIAGLTWVLWSFTELELPFVQDEGVNPIVRLSASLVIVSACVVPLLLDAAWNGVDGRRSGDT